MKSILIMGLLAVFLSSCIQGLQDGDTGSAAKPETVKFDPRAAASETAVDISETPAFGTPATATDTIIAYDSSATIGSRITDIAFPNPAAVIETNYFLDGTGAFVDASLIFGGIADIMTYPGAGIPLSTGSAWGTSYSLSTLLTALNLGDTYYTETEVDGLFNTVDIATTGTIQGNAEEVIDFASVTVTALDISGTIMTNHAEIDNADIILTLPDIDAFPGKTWIYHVAAAMSTYDICFKAAADNQFMLDGVAGVDDGCVCNNTPAIGDWLSCYTASTGTTGSGTSDIYCTSGNGTWVAVADNTGDCPD